MGREVTRRTVLAGAAAAGGAGLLQPGAAVAAKTLGEPRHGRAAAEVVGQILQETDHLTGQGYVTRLAGVPDADLFGATRDQQGARITWTAVADVIERFVQGPVVSVTAHGTLDLHAGGRRIARYTARYHNTAVVYAPNQAIAEITGELHQHSARRFSLAGHHHRVGERGLRMELSATGQGRRTQPTPPVATFDVAGRLDLAS